MLSHFFTVPLLATSALAQTGLAPKAFLSLPLGAIKPSGWLHDQLVVQNTGLAGHEHEFYHYVSESDWIGGNSYYSSLEEAGSYWFNGMVPSGVLLDDATIKSQTQQFLDYVLDHQDETGWLGPEVNTTKPRYLWGRYPFFFGAIQMVEADPSQTDRVVTALYNFVTLANSMLHNNEGLEDWTKTRWEDFVMTLEWLYDFHPSGQETLLIDTMNMLKWTGDPWEDVFSEKVRNLSSQSLRVRMMANDQVTQYFPTTAVENLDNPFNVLTWHGVNMAEGLKALPATYRFTHNQSGNLDRASEGWDLLFKYHGRPSGIYAADEYLAGLEAVRGTELCLVVETMFSYVTTLDYNVFMSDYEHIADHICIKSLETLNMLTEYVFEISAEAWRTYAFSSKVERITYNALPATLTGDMWSRQYLQEQNQIAAQNMSPNPFPEDGPYSNVFGLEPNYPCCTVNHPQGWPKFITNSFVTTPDQKSLAQVYLGPFSTKATLADGNTVSASVETLYPFGDTLATTITATKTFYVLRPNPELALSPKNGLQAVQAHAGTTKFVLNLPAEITTESRPHGSIAVHRGPLHYAFDIARNQTVLSRNSQESRAVDLQFEATQAWQYAIDLTTLKFNNNPPMSGSLPSPIFDSGLPPFTITVTACPIEWTAAGSTFASAPPESSNCVGNTTTITLWPFGMSEMSAAIRRLGCGTEKTNTAPDTLLRRVCGRDATDPRDSIYTVLSRAKSSSDKQPRQRRKLTKEEEMSRGLNHNAVTSSLDSIQILPRTPRSVRPAHEWTGGDEAGMDEVELSLLNEDERRLAGAGVDEFDGFPAGVGKAKSTLTGEDKKAMALLSILYLIQGVPIGLALGSVPFLLREHLSYSQLAIFALSSYPYSLKLLWSPIVDSVFITSVGRRKSWIIPMQSIIGSLMLYISFNVDKLMEAPGDHVYMLTFVFTSLVLIAATQDIAVDGWALTLLSQENLSYASTCQTIGLNTGYFASFTVFLAFNSEAFNEKWGVPHLSLSTYLRFWSIICFSVTIWLTFFQTERKEVLHDNAVSVTGVYKTIWSIMKLKHVQIFILMHLFAKIGFAANEAVTSLKIVEKGLGKEDLAVAVLIDFPFQIVGGWLAANWSRGESPLRPWLWAFWPRLAFALIATLIVYWFPSPPISTGFFVFLVVHTVFQSFSSTIQFVGISAFHTQISDPVIGGTYMTLLNTFTNLGGTWPKFFVLKGVDYFTIATCEVQESHLAVPAAECVSDHGKAHCADIGGQCVTERDGYYIVSAFCLTFGVIFLLAFIIPTARKLQVRQSKHGDLELPNRVMRNRRSSIVFGGRLPHRIHPFLVYHYHSNMPAHPMIIAKLRDTLCDLMKSLPEAPAEPEDYIVWGKKFMRVLNRLETLDRYIIDTEVDAWVKDVSAMLEPIAM
ncbi:hypothetical protein EW146_g4704 [Bondarzewia mesenterica]|uniref:Uncharacterized protein n=1 Tax=Bondarzewia mesenterica TaxID=1095465 RepID=A0A4S4LTQ8_9AGAM|nr:hypothetical protein EW146_g4704 [Bondarzewia mesenterica]